MDWRATVTALMDNYIYIYKAALIQSFCLRDEMTFWSLGKTQWHSISVCFVSCFVCQGICISVKEFLLLVLFCITHRFTLIWSVLTCALTLSWKPMGWFQHPLYAARRTQTSYAYHREHFVCFHRRSSFGCCHHHRYCWVRVWTRGLTYSPRPGCATYVLMSSRVPRHASLGRQGLSGHVRPSN